MKVDLTKPNSGRVADYWLGGQHNFQIDRMAARKQTELVPEVDWKLIYAIHRRFVQRTAQYMWQQGLDKFLDFGSGLPTMGNVHEAVPQARVLYTDNDEVTIAYGREILNDNPNVRYEYCDIRRPEEILDSPILEEFIGAERRLAFSATAMLHFLSDAEAIHFFKTMYDWADEGSHLAISQASKELEKNEEMRSVVEAFAKMGSPGWRRDPDEILALTGEWKVTQHGIVPVGTWGRAEGPEPGDIGLTWGLMLYK